MFLSQGDLNGTSFFLEVTMQSQFPTKHLLREINNQITWAKDVYTETGDAFHLGEISALDSLKNFILFTAQQEREEAEPTEISLADAA